MRIVHLGIHFILPAMIHWDFLVVFSLWIEEVWNVCHTAYFFITWESGEYVRNNDNSNKYMQLWENNKQDGVFFSSFNNATSSIVFFCLLNNEIWPMIAIYLLIKIHHFVVCIKFRATLNCIEIEFKWISRKSAACRYKKTLHYIYIIDQFLLFDVFFSCLVSKHVRSQVWTHGSAKVNR